MPAPILDTHAWVWWVQADPRLGRRTIEALDALPADDRHLPGDLVGQDQVRRDAAAVEALETVLFGGRETQDVSVQLWNGTLPPLPIIWDALRR